MQINNLLLKSIRWHEQSGCVLTFHFDAKNYKNICKIAPITPIDANQGAMYK